MDIDKVMQKNSSRHHYIPKFLIKGFTNVDGFLYVFDKKEDKISVKPRSPKSIFYELDRNTIELTQDKRSTILEDELYSRIDNQGSRIVKYYQEEELSKIDFSIENTAQFLFFLVTLFWRIPYTDFAAKNILDCAELSGNGIDPQNLKHDPTFQKLQRAGLFKHAVDEMKNSGKGGKVSINIHEHFKDIYVIGDNPILFRSVPKRFSEFGEIDFLMALSSKRIYSSTNDSLKNLNALNAYTYNAAVIRQSIR